MTLSPEQAKQVFDDRIRAPLVRVVDRLVDLLPGRLDRRFAVLTGGAALIALLVTCVVGGWLIHRADVERRAALGAMLAGQLAALTVEPLIVDDRILLGVLASRIADLDAVTNVTLLSIDDRVLAEAGTPVSPGAPAFAAPIVLEGDLAGYVRVVLAQRAFATSAGDIAAWFAIALAAVVLCGIAGHAVGARILRRRQLELAARAAAAANDEQTREPNARFFLVMNLFNQLRMPSVDRHAVIAACAQRLGAIARLYRGRCEPLPGTGLLMEFDADEAPSTAPESSGTEPAEPRAFEAVCAALLAVDVVSELAAAPPVTTVNGLDFRFALHVLDLPAEANRQSDAINDTVLLSAVAPGREIAASHDVFARIERKERLASRTQENAVLHALATARRGGCVLIAGADEELRGELDGQVDRLIAVVPSTSSPSTF